MKVSEKEFKSILKKYNKDYKRIIYLHTNWNFTLTIKQINYCIKMKNEV